MILNKSGKHKYKHTLFTCTHVHGSKSESMYEHRAKNVHAMSLFRKKALVIDVSVLAWVNVRTQTPFTLVLLSFSRENKNKSSKGSDDHNINNHCLESFKWLSKKVDGK